MIACPLDNDGRYHVWWHWAERTVSFKVSLSDAVKTFLRMFFAHCYSHRLFTYMWPSLASSLSRWFSAHCPYCVVPLSSTVSNLAFIGSIPLWLVLDSSAVTYRCVITCRRALTAVCNRMYIQELPQYERSAVHLLAEASDYSAKRPDQLRGAPGHHLVPRSRMHGGVP